MNVKLCICGDYAVGKSSMIEIIFNNAHPKDVWKHPNDQKTRIVTCLNKKITIIESIEPISDCDIIVLVLDANDYANDNGKSQIDWQLLSSSHHINILLHKMDTVQVGMKRKEMEIKKDALPTLVNVYSTSIWDESLYRAWSNIIHPLSPLKGMESGITVKGIEELILFDAGTFLSIVNVGNSSGSNALKSHKMEKISNISRQFRMKHKGKDRKRYELRTQNNDRLILDSLNEYIVALVVLKDESMEEWDKIKTSLQEKLA